MTKNETGGSLPSTRLLPGLGAFLFIILWFIGVSCLGYIGIFMQPNHLPLSNLQIAIVVPMILFWSVYNILPTFRTYIYNLDFLFLNTIQTWRVLGGAILLLWGYGLLPGGFALPMSILDMSVGVIAVFVVIAIAQNKSGWQRGAFWMNMWGFVDFWITLSLAIFAFKGLSFDPPAPGGIMTSPLEFPMSIFPSFAIPFFSCVHFAALMQLRRMRCLDEGGEKCA